MPRRSFPARRIKSMPTTWRRVRSKQRWPGRVARVALPTRTHFQCLQILDEGMHNDSVHRDATQGTFRSIVIESQAAIIEAAHERRPAGEHVAEGAGELGSAESFGNVVC